MQALSVIAATQRLNDSMAAQHEVAGSIPGWAGSIPVDTERENAGAALRFRRT